MAFFPPAAVSSAERHSATSGRTADRPMSSTNAINASISVMAGAPPLPPLELLCARRRLEDARRSCAASGRVMLLSILPPFVCSKHFWYLRVTCS